MEELYVYPGPVDRASGACRTPPIHPFRWSPHGSEIVPERQVMVISDDGAGFPGDIHMKRPPFSDGVSAR